MPLVQNAKSKKIVTRDTANATYTVASTAVGGETVVGLYITKIYWSGNWTVLRGANTLLKLSGSSHMELNGCALTEYSGADLVVQTDATGGSLIIEAHKVTSPEI